MDERDNEFLRLLEEYLDEEEIELKKQQDEECEELEIKEVKYNCIFTEDQKVPIGQFVNEYLGIETDASNLYHCGLKDLKSAYIMGVSNNFAYKHPEYVDNGFLLYVIDARNKPGTYINPLYLYRLVHDDELKEKYRIFKKKSANDLRKLSLYYNEYVRLRDEIELNQRFYSLLKATHKVTKLKKLKRKKEELLW